MAGGLRRGPRRTWLSRVVSRKRQAAYVGNGTTSGRSCEHSLSACSPNTCTRSRCACPQRGAGGANDTKGSLTEASVPVQGG